MTYSDINDLIDINLASGNKIPAIKHREVEHALLDYIQQNLSQSGDIKRVKCDLAYLNANFEVNGLGKNLRLGWAICNGINGTDNLAGRVGVGYGLGYSSLGSTGGSKDAVLVEHTHKTISRTGDVIPHVSSLSFYNQGQTWSATGTVNEKYSGISNEGISGTDKNMQPYIINLYIMKL